MFESKLSKRGPTHLALIVAGVAIALTLSVLFVPVARAGSTTTLWKVTFTETGLPTGTKWGVSLNGTGHASTNPTITFSVPNGKYAFSVQHRADYQLTPSGGKVKVNGADVAIAISFTPKGQTSSIVSNFNGNSIAAGDYIWFNSVLKPKSPIPTTGIRVSIVGQTISIPLSNGSTTTLSLPDAWVVYAPAASSGTTYFHEGANRWVTTVPVKFTDNAFMSGFAYQVPSGGLPGGLQSINWTGVFSVNANVTFSINWQWAAAVYTNFTSDYNSLGVKPLHSTSLDGYPNGNQAGTPELFKADVIGGARGGGGSNFTGSYSGTASVTPQVCLGS